MEKREFFFKFARKIVDLRLYYNIIKPIELLGIKKEVDFDVLNNRWDREKFYK